MGRARSSYKEMVLRTAVHEDALPPLDRISTFVNRLPNGQGPYIWGGSFHYYLLKKCSEQQVLASYQYNAGCFSAIQGCTGSRFSTCGCSVLTCFPLNSIFERTTGVSYYHHYEEWILSLKKRYKKEIRQIKEPFGR